MPQDYEIYDITSIKNNQNIPINDYGQLLLDLCIATKLIILVGRTRADLQGHITYISLKGCSTVELVLAFEICLLGKELIQYFSVLDLSHLSYHCPILFKLSKINSNISLKKQNESKSVKLEENCYGTFGKKLLRRIPSKV